MVWHLRSVGPKVHTDDHRQRQIAAVSAVAVAVVVAVISCMVVWLTVLLAV